MPKNSRVTTVLVPGEQPKPVAEQQAPAPAPAPDPAPAPAPASEQPASQPEAAQAAAAPGTDVDAMRAHIREEERAIIRAEEMAKLQDELAHQLKAATTVLAKPDTAVAPRSKADYRNMRAHQVDPATLTAPVLTLDGYVCPATPEKK